MRERFELHCKTVGLVIFCIGLYGSVTAIPLFFQKQPDVTRLWPQGVLSRLSPADVAEMEATTTYLWARGLQTLVLSGIAPMLVGLYLMRSRNLFVRLCYPENRGHSPSPAVPTDSVASEAGPAAPEGTDDARPARKYAPPGYFE